MTSDTAAQGAILLSDNDIRRAYRAQADAGDAWVAPFARAVAVQVQAWARRLNKAVTPLDLSDGAATELHHQHLAETNSASEVTFARWLEARMLACGQLELA